MNHEVFGEITYDADDYVWRGRCRLPVFAAFGKPPCHVVLEEPADDFRKGVFPLSIDDDTGAGPSPQQVSGFRYLVDNEADVCQPVMAALLESYRALHAWVERVKPYRDSRLWGWLARWVVGVSEQYQAPDDLKPAVRCTGVEVSSLSAGAHAYLGFTFDAEWVIEHGVAVVFHPTHGTSWGDATALASLTEAGNLDAK
jgi:hypothetical protein